MFSGLVEELGEFRSLCQTSELIQLSIFAPKIESSLQEGESVAVNGCCLTVKSHQNNLVQLDILEETLKCANLKKLLPGSRVNLERALRVSGRLGGHFVQGHVDTAARIHAISKKGADLRLDIEMPRDFARYMACKGSVALNGVSLTIAEIANEFFTVWVIPHTRIKTNLGMLSVGEDINLECDILAKYAERILTFK